jgi:CDP-diacylglycerol--glycerol-3-phosphate 3-phosphatidyltransferase
LGAELLRRLAHEHPGQDVHVLLRPAMSGVLPASGPLRARQPLSRRCEVTAGSHGHWRHVPNAISAARLLATPVLLSAVVQQRHDVFQWLLLACLLSDILDGLIARLFRLRSRLGALLDSTADMIVVSIAVAGIFVFQRSFLAEHRTPVLVLLTLYIAEAGASLWRYGKISSFHTILSRVAAYAQCTFVMSLFLWGYQAWIFRAMAVLSSIALV